MLYLRQKSEDYQQFGAVVIGGDVCINYVA